MSEDKIIELMAEIKKLNDEITELKKQNRILANALLSHIKGQFTIEDLAICYQKLAEVKKYTSIVPSYGYGGNSLEAIIAQRLLGEKEKKSEIEFEKVDEETLKKIRGEHERKNEDNTG
jgi:hypothetical protein